MTKALLNVLILLGRNFGNKSFTYPDFIQTDYIKLGYNAQWVYESMIPVLVDLGYVERTSKEGYQAEVYRVKTVFNTEHISNDPGMLKELL